MPLMLYNRAPLSFLDVERSDYATAMLGVYEQRNMAAAVDLFEFIYRRSIQKYSVLVLHCQHPTRSDQVPASLERVDAVRGLPWPNAGGRIRRRKSMPLTARRCASSRTPNWTS